MTEIYARSRGALKWVRQSHYSTPEEFEQAIGWDIKTLYEREILDPGRFEFVVVEAHRCYGLREWLLFKALITEEDVMEALL